MGKIQAAKDWMKDKRYLIDEQEASGETNPPSMFLIELKTIDTLPQANSHETCEMSMNRGFLLFGSFIRDLDTQAMPFIPLFS